MAHTEDYTVNSDKSVKTDNQQALLTGLLMAFEAAMKELSQHAEDSLKLHDIGIKTQLAKAIESSIKYPLVNIGEANNQIVQAVRKILLDFVTNYLKNQSQNLEFAYFTHENNATHLFLGLKEDTKEFRYTYYDMIDSYEKYAISNTFPLIIHFTPKELLGDVYNIKEITFGQQQSKSIPS